MGYFKSYNASHYVGAGLLGVAVGGVTYAILSPSTSPAKVDSGTAEAYLRRRAEEAKKLRERAALNSAK